MNFGFTDWNMYTRWKREKKKLRGNTKSPGKQKDEACNQDYVIWQAEKKKNCQNESAAFESDFWTLTENSCGMEQGNC